MENEEMTFKEKVLVSLETILVFIIIPAIAGMFEII